MVDGAYQLIFKATPAVPCAAWFTLHGPGPSGTWRVEATPTGSLAERLHALSTDDNATARVKAAITDAAIPAIRTILETGYLPRSGTLTVPLGDEYAPAILRVLDSDRPLAEPEHATVVLVHPHRPTRASATRRRAGRRRTT